MMLTNAGGGLFQLLAFYYTLPNTGAGLTKGRKGSLRKELRSKNKLLQNASLVLLDDE
jgi:hypothetical protein